MVVLTTSDYKMNNDLLLHQWSTGTISESLDCIELQKGACKVISAVSLRF